METSSDPPIQPDDSASALAAFKSLPENEQPSLEARRAALCEQANPALLTAAVRFAGQRAKMVRRAGRRVGPTYARELVGDVLGDTWTGTVAWDSARRSLLDHVRDVVKRRTWQDLTGARLRPHLPMDMTESKVSREAELAMASASCGSLTPIALSALARTVVAELRQLAHGDVAASAVLNAWADGDFDAEAIRARTGLSDKSYRAARARLTYFVRDLPASLRDAAVAALRSNP